jgi:hypothetical protein
MNHKGKHPGLLPQNSINARIPILENGAGRISGFKNLEGTLQAGEYGNRIAPVKGKFGEAEIEKHVAECINLVAVNVSDRASGRSVQIPAYQRNDDVASGLQRREIRRCLQPSA